MSKKLGLLIYSLGHLLVDGCCCLVMLGADGYGKENAQTLAMAIILYNTAAFALQPFFGLLADKIGHTQRIAFFGCILTGISALMRAPFAQAAAAGLGNAMFHVGGGAFSLNMNREKAVYAGLFVAPGAIGLFLGGIAAKTVNFSSWFVIIPMALLAVAVLPIPHLPNSFPNTVTKKRENAAMLPLLFLLLVITLRAVIGSVGVYPWKSTDTAGLLMVMSIALGKAAGGVLSDWAGRRTVTVIALLVSAPLLAFFESAIIPSLAGLFLFNLTMAVTVTEIADRLQGYSGFAFGLTTLALILGTYIIYLGWGRCFASPWVTLICISLSAIMMYVAIPADGKETFQTGGRNHERESVQKTM